MLTPKMLASTLVLLLASFATSPAQTPAPSAIPAAAPAVPKGFALIPYEQPQGTDPHADAITQTLASDLTAAGVTVTTVAPMEHLEAVANAAKICAENHATGLLIPEGRYEQTLKSLYLFYVTIVKYPAHVSIRLDDVACDGSVAWSTTTTGDQAATGVDRAGNVGAAIDAAFRDAAKKAAQNFAAATVPPSTQGPAPVAAVVATPGPTSAYLLLSQQQPSIDDPYAADVTHSLLLQLQQRKLDVKLADPMDRLTAVTGASHLCAANAAQGIIVPDFRIEQSEYSGRSHATLRLTLLSCGGSVLGHSFTQADMGNGTMVNFGASAVGVSERAMGPAIDQLFPSTKQQQAAAKIGTQ